MRELLVFGKNEFKITIPDEAKVTFGPWSPPSERRNYEGGSFGTLRIYASHKSGADIIFVESGVTGYRDTSAIGYAEKVAREEGATIWKDDEKGYVRDAKVTRKYEWVAPELPERSEG